MCHHVEAPHWASCHPTCKTCTPDGLGCASCWQGGFLHLGHCVTRCSIGYYANIEGSCSRCHPSCESCNGGTNKNCTSCYNGFYITKKGKCKSQCDKGKYLSQDTGNCKDCASGCSECHLFWNNEDMVCNSCNERNMVTSADTCLEKCPVGKYQEYKTCKDCGENCLTCSSPTTCTRCKKNMLLYHGLCVQHCAQGQYEDGQTMSCKACGKSCLRCYSETDCSVCDGGSYLKDGSCVQNCGQHFTANNENMECQCKSN
ncbi:Extracellular matrix protein fras1 [Mactra antiquata]